MQTQCAQAWKDLDVAAVRIGEFVSANGKQVRHAGECHRNGMEVHTDNVAGNVNEQLFDGLTLRFRSADIFPDGVEQKRSGAA